MTAAAFLFSQVTRSSNNPWLHRFAVLTALATLALLGVGGVVTSKGAGMAVPDWPTSYGYNMFALPFEFWKGGALYEHSHRLVASAVGFLTTILAVWLWFKESRAWLRWLGVIAFIGVVFQGVLGGLRVVWLNDELGIFHATLAQLFFALICAIALFTSKWWLNLPSPLTPLPSDGRGEQLLNLSRKLRTLFLFTTVLIFMQLALGATMRHQHAGLAVPDFPLAYGRLWPAMDADSIERYNAQRIEVTAANPITAFQIGLQMLHRLMAAAILVCVIVTAWRTRSWSSRFSVSGDKDNLKVELQPRMLSRLATVWLALILVQVGLGAWTIWSDKAADVATAHVLVGALSLVTGVLGCIICFRRLSVPVGAMLAATSLETSHAGNYRVNPATALNH
jgi:cytochrome c oxidase assembly protein subunit 15